MTVFVVISREKKPELESAIARLYAGEKHFRFGDTAWLVADKGSVREVTEKMGIKKGGITGVLVLAAGPYFGVASTQLWDWMRARIEEAESG